MRMTILGGGLAALTLAYFLQDDARITSIEILEQEDTIGGLCRSFDHNGLTVDIGPHIFFSKNQAALDFLLDLLGENKHKLRRSNRIIHQGVFVQYPFENDLSKLPPADRDRCLTCFLDNPYRDYEAKNMLQFFLATFGAGICDLYLRPYNEKIWKFDPAFMDTQMVERIPRPPDDDIKRSAAGETVDGYLHQLYFHYPIEGGVQAMIDALAARLTEKVKIHTNSKVTKVARTKNGYITSTGSVDYRSDLLVSTMPVNILAEIYDPEGHADAPSSSNMPETSPSDTAPSGHSSFADMKECAAKLRYNHIIIALATVSSCQAGDNFAFMIADREVVFHRLSQVDFLGEAYHKPDTATYMMEYTYRDGDLLAGQSDEELRARFCDGLKRIGFIASEEEVLDFSLRRFPYAYVIYDLAHRENMRIIRDYFGNEGVCLNGRFGDFEYLNMDAVVAKSMETAERIKSEMHKP